MELAYKDMSVEQARLHFKEIKETSPLIPPIKPKRIPGKK
jgi:hypothetical protein